MNDSKFNIQEGTISFWIKQDKVIYNNNLSMPIINLHPDLGSIFVVKDIDNKLKFFHIYLDKGRNDLEYDISNLDYKKDHMFVYTWSIKNKEIKLYIDGVKVAENSINY